MFKRKKKEDRRLDFVKWRNAIEWKGKIETLKNNITSKIEDILYQIEDINDNHYENELDSLSDYFYLVIDIRRELENLIKYIEKEGEK